MTYEFCRPRRNIEVQRLIESLRQRSHDLPGLCELDVRLRIHMGAPAYLRTQLFFTRDKSLNTDCRHDVAIKVSSPRRKSRS